MYAGMGFHDPAEMMGKRDGGEPEGKEPSKKPSAGGKNPPHIHIHAVGKKVHVHVLHHNKPPEHHEHDHGDPAIGAHVQQHFGGGGQAEEAPEAAEPAPMLGQV